MKNNNKNKNRFYLVVFDKIEDRYVFRKSEEIKKDFNIVVKMKNKSNISINKNNPTYVKNQSFYYFVYIDSENISHNLTFNETSQFSIDVLDKFLNEHVVSEIVRNHNFVNKVGWRDMILPFFLGLILGAFIVYIFLSNQNTQYLM